jgi:AbrB family transcriptional regulator (stage V sporulation protein T)
MDKHRTAWQSCPYRVRIAAGGRIVIPAEVRQLLGIRVGEELLLTRDEVGFRLTTSRQAILQAQSLFAKLKGEGESVVEELLRERRDEAAREESEFRERYSRD